MRNYELRITNYELRVYNEFLFPSFLRTVVGFIGTSNQSDFRPQWNARFLRDGRDAFFDFYRTQIDDLPLRLSEMFVLERRGYIVSSDLSQAIIPLLDRLDSSVRDRVNIVVNEGGVLIGYCIDEQDIESKAHQMWFIDDRSPNRLHE